MTNGISDDPFLLYIILFIMTVLTLSSVGTEWGQTKI